MHIQVNPVSGHQGELSFGPILYPCALGKAGVTTYKKEGDHASPIGKYVLRDLYYRPDRLAKPVCTLPIHEISKIDGWCDDPEHPDYNRKITLPFTASHESLFREDSLYDLIVILGHNDDPPVPGAGSCIFMHVATADYSGTEGCVALKQSHLLELLAAIPRHTELEILPVKTG